MTTKQRVLSLLLMLCIVAGTFALPSQAATPTALTVQQLAAGAQSNAATIEKAISSGTKTANGTYSNIAFPANVTVAGYTVDVGSYIRMAAAAVKALGDGKANTTSITYTNSSIENHVVNGSVDPVITKGQYLDLAYRVEKYAVITGGMIATSFNAPSDGFSDYRGRICIYSVAHILTEVLQDYAANGKLPDSVTFLPTNFTGAVAEPEVDVSGLGFAEIFEAAKYVVDYIEKNEAMPSSVPVGSNTTTHAQFMYMACQAILAINQGKTNEAIAVPQKYSEPSNPSETLTAGSLNLTEILDLAQRSINFMINNGVAANYMITSLGNMHHYGAIHMYSRVLLYFMENSKLPASLKVETWFKTIGGTSGDATFGNDFSSYAKYLTPTANCPSTNTTIISVAKTAMLYSGGAQGGYSSPTTTYQAMFNLMEYINDKTSYEFYYDTSRGALGTWRDKQGNCCDMAHLVVACARSLGVPARYYHYYCHFSSMSTGHVFAGLYCPDAPGTNKYNKAGWLFADPVNNANYLGYQTHTNAYQKSGPWAELPF